VRTVPLALLALLAACGRPGALDTVADTSADPTVWRGDAQKIASVLPTKIGAFAPSEAADPFWTSYRTGPVFGASCVYAEAGRQLTVRVETGNIAARAATALDPKPGPDDRPTGSEVREVTVKGAPGVSRWDERGRTGEVTFVVARRYLVQLRLVPGATAGETMALAEGIDVGPLAALALDGVR
jgi:hypothetical protein